MTKFITILCIIGVTAVFAQGGLCKDKEERQKKCKPPKQAIEACEGQASGSVCKSTSRHGDILNGTCRNTPDENYFACVPDRKPKKER